MAEKSELDETPMYGGQAVIEGVMMRSPRYASVAVRRPNGQIVVRTEPLVTFAMRHKWARWPFIRGTFALIEAFTLGLWSLNYSAEIAMEAEPREVAAGEPAPEPSKPLSPWAFAGTMVLALALGTALFVLAPSWVTDLVVHTPPAVGPARVLDGVIPGGVRADVVKNLVEGLLRLLIIIGYIAGVSLLGQIRRVFEYHGAEHKVIHAYEAVGRPDGSAARGESPLHPRCGTAFVLVVVVVKVIVNLFLGWPHVLVRSLLRIAVLPIVAGLAYEIIRFAGRHKGSAVLRGILAPSLWLQRLTTREPDEALEAVRAAEEGRAPVADADAAPAGGQTPCR
jgi:uncharacterized protein YqhQ